MAARLGLFRGLKQRIFDSYTKSLDKNLRALGLRYDDLLDPLQDPDVEVALRRIPAAEVEGRNARLRRALNLSMKKEELPEDMQAMQTPFMHYLLPELKKVRMENREAKALNTPRAYRRSLP